MHTLCTKDPKDTNWRAWNHHLRWDFFSSGFQHRKRQLPVAVLLEAVLPGATLPVAVPLGAVLPGATFPDAVYLSQFYLTPLFRLQSTWRSSTWRSSTWRSIIDAALYDAVQLEKLRSKKAGRQI